ncbi:MAG: formate dehydrogenase subunit gamma [Rhodobiaceae bacterium]|nr:formate dehydrogenase subunit gamma [Rhodobiaceae bacterium]
MGRTFGTIARCLAGLTLLVILFSGAVPAPVAAQSSPDQVPAGAPSNTLGPASDADIWRAVRQGIQGSVSIPDKKAGTLVQSEGDVWREIHNGPVPTYGAYALAATVGFLALFFLLRGRVRIESGWSGIKITRFKGWERTGHWLIAGSFIILALSGLNLLFGRYFLIDLIGPAAFAQITHFGKLLHNYVAFAFMAGLAWVFLAWVWYNLPHWRDINWLVRAGGLLSKHSHPPAAKFNAGQKIIFWLTVLGGFSASLSGWSLLFPFTTSFFADTFSHVNALFGTSLPTDLTHMQEQQLSQVWHAIVGIVLTCIIIAHIYIGSIGMQGAFAAMGSGEVDLNWAKEHHSLWVKTHKDWIHTDTPPKDAGEAPAE